MNDFSGLVSFQSCTSYDDEVVYEAVRNALNDLGGLDSIIKSGMKVALKPNLLLPINPDNCATTNPAVVGAVGRLVMEAGGTPTVVESPGGLYNKTILKALYKSCGISSVCEKFGIKLNFDTTVERVTADCLGRKRSFNVLKPLIDADFIINISKLKTHGMMVFTGAVKNMFGSIAGVEKAAHHMNMPDYDAFADNIIDICEATKPNLSVMDGIMAMEGNGPSAGTPKALGVVIASYSPYLCDKAAHDIIKLDVHDSYILTQASKRGVNLEYTAAGDGIEPFVCSDFNIPFKKSMGITKKGILNSRLLTQFKSKPVVDKDICVGCEVCKNNCPAEVIYMKNSIPDFDYRGCIRCFCCQELCPEHAISIKKPLLIKLLKAGRK
jgi:uncharacterized protein (DUF362 family)/Pyruvate/2-oxoacid:ferredoxin oxidoreductase delta subunit